MDDGWYDAYPLMLPMDRVPMDLQTRDSLPNVIIHLATVMNSPDDDDDGDDDVVARAYISFPQRRLHCGVNPTNSHQRRCSFRSWNLNHHPGLKILHY